MCGENKKIHYNIEDGQNAINSPETSNNEPLR